MVYSVFVSVLFLDGPNAPKWSNEINQTSFFWGEKKRRPPENRHGNGIKNENPAIINKT